MKLIFTKHLSRFKETKEKLHLIFHYIFVLVIKNERNIRNENKNYSNRNLFLNCT